MGDDLAGEMNLPTGLRKHPAGSKEKFWGLWAHRRAMIQAVHDPVAAARYGEGMRQATQRIQNEAIARLELDIQYAWEGELGELWRWADRVDLGLLGEQLDRLAIVQAEDPLVETPKWQALEGVLNLLGGLRDWLEKGEGR